MMQQDLSKTAVGSGGITSVKKTLVGQLQKLLFVLGVKKNSCSPLSNDRMASQCCIVHVPVESVLPWIKTQNSSLGAENTAVHGKVDERYGKAMSGYGTLKRQSKQGQAQKSHMYLNIGLSWKKNLAGNYYQAKMYITSMVSGMITVLKIWSFGRSLNLLESGQEKINTAQPALVRLSSGVFTLA